MQDGKASAVIEKIAITITDNPLNSWFKPKILGGLNGADVEFVNPSANYCEHGIVTVHLLTAGGVLGLDYPMGNIGYNRNKGIAARGREYFFSRVIDNFYNDSKAGGILEIGSGTGDFLVHASSRGIRVKGIEPNEDLYFIALERVGQGFIEKCALDTFSTKCKFELIFSNSVIEHVNEPVNFLDRASNLLNENGVIVITAPTPADYFWDDPTHKRPYTTKSFIELGYLTKLELIYCSTTFGFLIGKSMKSPFVSKVLNMLPGHFGSNIIAVYRKPITSESTQSEIH